MAIGGLRERAETIKGLNIAGDLDEFLRPWDGFRLSVGAIEGLVGQGIPSVAGFLRAAGTSSARIGEGGFLEVGRHRLKGKSLTKWLGYWRFKRRDAVSAQAA